MLQKVLKSGLLEIICTSRVFWTSIAVLSRILRLPTKTLQLARTAAHGMVYHEPSVTDMVPTWSYIPCSCQCMQRLSCQISFIGTVNFDIPTAIPKISMCGMWKLQQLIINGGRWNCYPFSSGLWMSLFKCPLAGPIHGRCQRWWRCWASTSTGSLLAGRCEDGACWVVGWCWLGFVGKWWPRMVWPMGGSWYRGMGRGWPWYGEQWGAPRTTFAATAHASTQSTAITAPSSMDVDQQHVDQEWVDKSWSNDQWWSSNRRWSHNQWWSQKSWNSGWKKVWKDHGPKEQGIKAPWGGRHAEKPMHGQQVKGGFIIDGEKWP